MKIFGQKTCFVIAVVLAIMLAQFPAAAQQRIGATAVVVNDVTGTLGDEFRKLTIGASIRQNEVIETGRDSRSQIIFADETVLTVAPLSKVVLDEVVFDPAAQDGEFKVSVSVGVMRFISGAIAPSKYQIRTPTSIIGIRGTIFDLVVENTGATTVVLRSGALTISNLANVSQTVTQPGQASTVSSTGAAPTPPAPASAGLNQQLQAVAGPGASAARPPSVRTPPPGGAGQPPPVPPHVITEATDENGAPGSAGLH